MKKLLILFAAISLFSTGCKKNVITSENTEIQNSNTKKIASVTSLLWDGDASNGTGVFQGIETIHADIGVITDSILEEKVFKFRVYDVPDGTSSDRAEARGMKNITIQNNTTYYLGWKQKYGNPLPNPSSANWVNVFQWKAYPAQTGFNYPIVISANSGNLRVFYQKPDGSQEVAWGLGSIPVNEWVSWVLKIHTSTDPSVGYVEIWYNGSYKAKVFMKTFATGSSVQPKWGIYRTSRIDADAQTYLYRPRMGTTYNDVAPPATYYKIKVLNNPNYFLHSASATPTNGTNVDVYANGTYTTQQWQLINTENGYKRIASKINNNLVLESATTAANGVNVRLGTWGGNTNTSQQWLLTDIGGGAYKISLRADATKVLECSATPANGINVNMWNYVGNNRQQWILEPVY